MKYKNIITKKENVKYVPGDVLTMYTETYFEERVYMVIRSCGMYNMLNLNNGEVYYSDFEAYDDFAEKVEQIFTFIEVIDNNELELVRVED